MIHNNAKLYKKNWRELDFSLFPYSLCHFSDEVENRQIYTRKTGQNDLKKT